MVGALGASTTAIAADDYIPLGGWQLLVSTDAMTDMSRSIAAATGSGGSLGVKCDGEGTNEMYIIFASDQYLGGGRSPRRPIMVRFDQDTPEYWTFYIDKSIAMITNAAQVNKFAARIVNTRKLTLRLTDYEGAYVDAVIDTADGKEALERAYKACGQTAPWAAATP